MEGGTVMSLAIVTFTYVVTVFLALGLLYLFGSLRWYWHALSVTLALVMGVIPMRVFAAWASPVFDLAYGNVIVFFLLWGICAPFFRHYHMPVHHH
jgi:hypothetical protein